MKSLEAKISISKVLVAVDLSNHSKATAMYAAELAKSFDAFLTIVYVYKPVPLYDYAKDTTYKRIEGQREELQKLLNELTERVQKTGLVCDSIFLIGDPAEEISALARDKNVDLIITGSHHPTFLARLFNLENAPHILHRAPCPILVYHEKETQHRFHTSLLLGRHVHLRRFDSSIARREPSWKSAGLQLFPYKIASAREREHQQQKKEFRDAFLFHRPRVSHCYDNTHYWFVTAEI
jgi:universal stress protein A